MRRRVPSWCLVLAFLAVLVLAAAPSATAATSDEALAGQVSAEINGLRVGEGLHTLRQSPALTQAALAHALSMADLGYFSHSSFDGTSASARIGAYLSPRSAKSRTLGEVILWTTGTISAPDAVARWLASTPHRAELLRAGWRAFGIATVHASNAPGTFGGRDVTIIVVDFARGR